MKNSIKILSISLILLITLSSTSYAKLSADQVEKINQAASSLTDEQKDQIESAAYQIAYKIMDTAISKSLSVLDKVNTKLNDEALQIPEETKSLIEDQMEDLENLLIEQQTNLKNANSIADLKAIQVDLTEGLSDNAKEVQKMFIDKAQELIIQAEAALIALEKTCGADVSSQQAQLDKLSEEINAYELALESNETMSKEDLQAQLKEFNPEEIQSQMQSVAGDIEELQSQCPTAPQE